MNALKRGKDIGINKLDLVTDDKYMYDVMTGTKDVTKCDYADVCIECIELAKQYKVCNIRHEPRQRLGIVNEMARAKFSQAVQLSDILEAKSDGLWGLPVLRITQSESLILRRLG